jgi:hypothetical protein
MKDTMAKLYDKNKVLEEQLSAFKTPSSPSYPSSNGQEVHQFCDLFPVPSSSPSSLDSTANGGPQLSDFVFSDLVQDNNSARPTLQQVRLQCLLGSFQVIFNFI